MTTPPALTPSEVIPAALATRFATETRRFTATHPRSMALTAQAAQHFLFGVPLHWMRDWPSPATLCVQHAHGAHLTCADGLAYSDFCLGDTGAMFGHSPAPVAQAIAQQAARGLTSMLPSVQTAEVGALLAATFGLPQWQMALTASDANRFVLRWARAVTQRPQLLVFDGCYHGAVDDTLVDLEDGRTVPRPSVLGNVHNHAAFTRIVPFNDLAALEAALADRQVACLLAEPALTNCGLVLPDPGFWQAAQALCARFGTLLALDETHTLSTGCGGYARVHGLAPDLLVIGKAVAGGLPCAVYGFTDALAQRMMDAKRAAPEGHSGVGTTLAGNALTIAALHAALTHLHTPATYTPMLALADTLAAGLHDRITAHGLDWSVTQLGARMELHYAAQPPRNATEVHAASQPALDALLHLFMLNRGVLLTPFHTMLLVSPATSSEDVLHLLDGFSAFLTP
ncbi:MAG: aminotransferase class III-fold pyridoxal phosphate-dependent enzyme [Ferruginibacter sp.]|nr:aminotransferase class III-fold pyridoxal phosphate-dependent enzyme [Rhodoferax sp.]